MFGWGWRTETDTVYHQERGAPKGHASLKHLRI